MRTWSVRRSYGPWSAKSRMLFASLSALTRHYFWYASARHDTSLVKAERVTSKDRMDLCLFRAAKLQSTIRSIGCCFD